jgi:peptidylprolyl isomerase
MRSLLLLTAAALLVGAAPAKKLPTPTDVVAAAPASAWRTIAPEDLLVMDLANGGRIIIQLAPGFAPVHVANIRALARGNYWDGATI